MRQAIGWRAPLRIDLAGGWTDVPPYNEELQGAVVNVAISHYVEGRVRWDPAFHLEYGLRLPTGTGLGTSGAMNVVYLALLSPDPSPDRARLAEEAWRFESQILGIKGGWQDQIAAAFGGLSFIDTNGPSATRYEMRPAAAWLEELERRLVLVYTGESHFSSDVHRDVWRRFEAEDRGLHDALVAIAGAARAMRTAVERENFEALAACMEENWRAQQRLYYGMCTDRMASIIEVARPDACKATGAGAGGCVLLYAENARAMHARLEAAGIRPLEFTFDFQGLSGGRREDG